MILNKIETVGNDLDFHVPVAGPTVLVQEMTMAGE
jgi:predicted Zn-dependent protease